MARVKRKPGQTLSTAPSRQTIKKHDKTDTSAGPRANMARVLASLGHASTPATTTTTTKCCRTTRSTSSRPIPFAITLIYSSDPEASISVGQVIRFRVTGPVGYTTRRLSYYKQQSIMSPMRFQPKHIVHYHSNYQINGVTVIDCVAPAAGGLRFEVEFRKAEDGWEVEHAVLPGIVVDRVWKQSTREECSRGGFCEQIED